MKKCFAMMLAVLLAFGVCMVALAQDSDVQSQESVNSEQLANLFMQLLLESSKTNAVPEEDKNEKATETEHVKLEGCFVDSSYKDPEGKPLKLVYLFLTLMATDENLEVDPKYSNMTIGKNKYSSDMYGDCRFMPSYYYEKYIEDVYIGADIKLALTFKVPEGDLQPGKKIVLSDDKMPLDEIRFTTDDLVFCDSVEQIGECVDPEGYADMMRKREPADDVTKQKVSKELNGKYWRFYVTVGTTIQTYELEFSKPNKFELRTSLGSRSSGTYEVRNGYVFLTYSPDIPTVEVEYEIVDNQLNLYCSDAFEI